MAIVQSSSYTFLIKLFIFSFLSGLLIFIFIFLPSNTIYASDFISFLTGAKILIGSQQSLLYDINFQYEIQKLVTSPYYFEGKMVLPFLYLPFYAVFFVPFLFIPVWVGYRIFVLILLVLLFYFVRQLKKTFEISFKLTTLFISLLFYLPITASLFAPQISILIVLLFLFLYKAFSKKNYFIGGFLTSLLLIKPSFLISLPFLFLLTKDKRAYIKGFILGTISLLMVSGFLIDFASLKNYFSFLAFINKPEFGNRPEYSFGALPIFEILIKSKQIVYLLYSGLFAFTVYLFTKLSSKLELKFFSLIFLTGLFSPHMLLHDMVVFTLAPFLFLKDKNLKTLSVQKNRALVLFFVGLFIIPLFSVWGKAWVTTLIYFLSFLALLIL